jgi:hypothetical protein
MSTHNTHLINLVVAAAFYHPESTVRDRLCSKLEGWLKKLGDRADAEQIRTVLENNKGTYLEPFVLSKADLDCSAFLARLASSRTAEQTRFRVVSRDTIGTDGGLVLTNNGNAFYVERYAYGQRRGQPKKSWVFFPALRPEAGSTQALNKRAKLLSESEGFRIVLDLPRSGKSPAAIAADFQKHGRIEGVTDTFNKLGLRVEFSGEKLNILSGSPESMIRIMAHMTTNARVRLMGTDEDTEMPHVIVGLGIPDEDPVDLPVIASSTGSYTCWLQGDFPEAPSLDDEDKLAVSSWLPPHRDWLDLAFEKIS